MNILERFMEYALAFEETLKDDNWQRLETYFAPNAVYKTNSAPLFPPVCDGREAVLAGLKDALDLFDRRFDTRTVDVTGEPEIGTDSIAFNWTGVYAREGIDDLKIAGREEIKYNGNEIIHMEDFWADGMISKIDDFLKTHDASLKPAANS